MYTINKIYKSADNLAEEICGFYADGNDFTVICDDKVASVLTKRFLQFNEDTKAFDIQLSCPEMDGYCDEYNVSCVGNELYVQPARNNGIPLMCGEENPVHIQSGFVSEDFIDEDIIGNTVIKFTLAE